MQLRGPAIRMLSAATSIKRIAAILGCALLCLTSPVQSQWLLAGPYGGYRSVNDFLFSGSNILAATDSGVFVSSDHGDSWHRAAMQIVNPSIDIDVGALVQATDGTSTFEFAGTKFGVYHSTDDGATWALTSLDNMSAYLLAVSGTSLFAAADSGIYRSTDFGSSWTRVRNTGFTALAAANGMLFGGTGWSYNMGVETNGGVFRSTDNGVTWGPVNSGLPDSYLDIQRLASMGRYLFAGTSMNGLFRSSDDGDHWIADTTGLTGSYGRAIAVAGQDLLVGTTDGVFVSGDSGATWTATGLTWLSNGLAASGSTWYAGTAGVGVYRSTDHGATWRSINAGLLWITQFGTSAMMDIPDGKGGRIIFAGTTKGIIRSTDGGVYWTDWWDAGLSMELINALTNITTGAIAPQVYAGSNGGVFRSTDAGLTWTEADQGLTNESVFALAATPEGNPGPSVLASTYGSMFLSTDGGENWARTGYPGFCAGQAFAAGKTLIAGWDSLGICRSTDLGATWAPISELFSGSDKAFGKCYLEVPEGSGDTSVYAGVSMLGNGSGVYRSTDFGLHWVQLTGYPNPIATAIAASPTAMFAADGFKVYVSTDQGGSWRHVFPDIPEQWYISSMAVSGANLVLGTFGGMFRRDITEIVTDVEPRLTSVPEGFRLEQNYPNPFNPTTVVRGQWPENSEVRLAVYDVLGREVAVLANGRYPAGAHSFAFDGTNLASGVYFYRLTAGGHSAVRRMVLLR